MAVSGLISSRISHSGFEAKVGVDFLACNTFIDSII